MTTTRGRPKISFLSLKAMAALLNHPLALAVLGYTLYNGAPLPRRPLGGEERPFLQPKANDDAKHPFRGHGPYKELTTEPVIPVDAEHPAYTNSPRRTNGEPEGVRDVIIIGGAAGGMCAGASLKRRGVHNILILEKNGRPGDIWRSRYHRLHLHDIAEECSLPGLDVPTDFPVYADRNEYAEYLDSYCEMLKIPIRCGSLVRRAVHPSSTSAGGDGKLWTVEVEDLATKEVYVLKAKHVVLANGLYNDPVIPNIKGRETFKGFQCHSCRYTNATGLNLVGKKVLVVGFGNSACEISVDLCEHEARPTLFARSPALVVPRWFVGKLERMVHSHIKPLLQVPFGWAPALGILSLVDPVTYLVNYAEYGGSAGLKELGFPQHWKGPVMLMVTEQGVPTQDVGTVELARKGLLKVISGTEIVEVREGGVVFANDPGRVHEFDAIIWATGYEEFSGHKHIFDEETRRRMPSGVNALASNRIIPGSEIPGVPRLHAQFGRIQMLRDGSKVLSKKIAADLGITNPVADAVDLGDSWGGFALKHLAVAGAAYGIKRVVGGGSAARSKL